MEKDSEGVMFIEKNRCVKFIMNNEYLERVKGGIYNE